MSNWGPPLIDGEPIELETKTWYLGCCGCGLAHRIDFEVKRGKVYVKLYRQNRATAQRRRYKKCELLNGEDPTWEMVRK